MFGDKGCGKMMVTGYVAELLASRGNTVCSYFCCNDAERDNTAHLYRSCLLQLLSSEWSLYDSYKKLLSEDTTMDWQKQAWSPAKLRKHLVALIKAATKQVYFIIDSLDELPYDSLQDIHDFFTKLSPLDSGCKLFLSSRHDSLVKDLVPGKAFTMQLSQDEARRIAIHLVRNKFFQRPRSRRVPESDRRRLIERTAASAKGSALWVFLILKYVDMLANALHLPPIEELLQAIEQAPSDGSKIPHVWAKLREQVLRREGEVTALDESLEFVAFSPRHVTASELAFSNALNVSHGGETLPKLQSGEGEALLDMCRVFFAIEEVPKAETCWFTDNATEKAAKDKHAGAAVTLVHPSLRELIIQRSPRSWDSSSGSQESETAGERQTRIHGQLASKCIRYILHADFSRNSSVPESRKAEFFNYAASAWHWHLSKCSNPTLQQLNDAILICKPGSSLLKNWTEAYRHPSIGCAENGFLPETSRLDPFVIAVKLNLHSLADALLQRPDIFKAPYFHPSSAEAAIETALYTDQFSLATKIFAQSGRTLHELSVFTKLMAICNPEESFWSSTNEEVRRGKGFNDGELRDNGAAARAARAAEWEKFFSRVIPALLPQLIKWGPEALCSAVSYGCHSVVRTLFGLADKQPKLAKALLEDRGRKSQHQSVGLAAERGDLEMVRLLCRRPGIERHIKHIGPSGQTVFHAAAQMTSTDWQPDIVRELRRIWPEGFDELDHQGRHLRDFLRPGETLEL
ncbi:hypothetical protein MPH_11728 [Macrophomina phaseolina MS6]|uniref:Nephrocystin 3-like N-terminal domain-containing protein n=1 Tax=Macrophomina phaseolina (strain MS6) TaxID=1126212 RepID=K2S378_MACPH|nr:hypothetical protein MPH_11728 [Macrophomina phaseolina MS6]